MKPDAFVALIVAGAQESMRATKVPASFTIARAALESGWEKSGLAVIGKNLFGVKADKSWTGPTLSMPTKEFIDGREVTVMALWRKYLSWADSLTDHAKTDNAEQFALAIAAAGYATDPQYVAKVIAVIRSHNLTQYDKA